jgi:hypothetical protein
MTIVNNTVNDCAMTVLPDAPIDPATGLPVPTIAVATYGGVSVIKDDGTVAADPLGFACSSIIFKEDGDVYVGRSGTNDVFIIPAPAYNAARPDYTHYDSDTAPYILSGAVADLTVSSFGHSNGLTVLAEDKATPANGMVAYVTSSYNSGYQNGDIKGAFLSDTDDTDLVGSGNLGPDLTSYADQAAAVADGWSIVQTGWTFDAANDEWVHDGVANGNILYGTVALEDGKPYYLTFDVENSGAVTAYVGTGDQVGSYQAGLGVGSYGIWLNAGTQGDFIQFRRTSGAPQVKNITLYKGNADRSVNNKGLIVNGTVTRTPVATGADLVGYTPSTITSNLTQPYNSDLDFGTGDFVFSTWLKQGSGTTVQSFVSKGDAAASGNRINNFLAATTREWTIFINGTSRTTSYVPPTNTWVKLDAVRRNGVLYAYANGELVYSASESGSLTNSTAVTVVGGVYTGTQGATDCSLALFRISATAPSAEQIAKIYNDEKHLFQENAQATLYGTSDAVTALAHDPDTNLLHVGTSAGRSTFDGLRRIDNTTDAVTTAISASGGFILEQ